MKDYDCTIEYHPGKANVVADALSHKTVEILAKIICYKKENLVALRVMNLNLEVKKDHLLAVLKIPPKFMDQIRESQMEDAYLKTMKEKLEMGVNTQFTIREDGMLVIDNRVCVSKEGELRRQIIEEAHTASYAMHPGSTKMYRDLKSFYWWPTMRKDVVEYMAKCLTCQ